MTGTAAVQAIGSTIIPAALCGSQPTCRARVAPPCRAPQRAHLHRRRTCCPCCPLPSVQALVDFPGQTRRVISFKRMALTDFTVDIPRLAKKSVLAKALEEAGEWGGAGQGSAGLG